MPDVEHQKPEPGAEAPGRRRSGFFLVGPTAVGKTAVAHVLAGRLALPVLSADSMMVYRHMDLGTAKPTRAELETHRYAGIDLTDPDRDFSVAEYLRAVSARSEQHWIVCGGTGLYVRCLTEGLREIPAASDAIRARADELLSAGGVEALQAELERVAPGRLAALADPKNPRRLVRALEEASSPGGAMPGAAPPGAWKRREEPRPVLVGLRMDKAALERRIRSRVARMYADGLLREAASLRGRFERLSKTALQAIGYAEAFAVLDGKLDERGAMELTAVRSRQLAKKQMTWFRRQHVVEWVEVGEGDPLEKTADDVLACWKKHGPTLYD